VADDESELRRARSRVLASLGHDVIEAEDGRGVVKAVQIGAVDLVVTDINMPDMDGLEVVKSVRTLDADLPVIVVSGGGLFAKHMLLRNAGALGAFATLEKPFDFGELSRTVERALAGVDPQSRSDP
jgi:DNA-binding NtrC family response regulator